jgi:hypothetical protein
MPGPLPQSRPTFPPEFLAEAERLVRRRTAAAHLRQRARLALLLHEEPLLPYPEAAAHVGLHPNSVRLWRRRWSDGLFSLEDQPGRGRKPSFSPPGPGAGHGPGLRGRGPER